jgi:hypothetical protein
MFGAVADSVLGGPVREVPAGTEFRKCVVHVSLNHVQRYAELGCDGPVTFSASTGIRILASEECPDR